MEQLTKYKELLNKFDNEIVDCLNNFGNTVDIINKFIPPMIEAEKNLKQSIIESKRSIRSKSDINELSKFHRLIQNLLNDLLRTSPYKENYKIVEKLCFNNNLKLMLKVSTCITGIFL